MTDEPYIVNTHAIRHSNTPIYKTCKVKLSIFFKSIFKKLLHYTPK